MNIPKSIWKDIQDVKRIRERANNIEQNIFQWFEDKGIDIEDMNFIDSIGSRITYGEFSTIEEFNDVLDEYIKKMKKRSEINGYNL
ncbi:hypothetical protein [Clostridium sp.]|uniref:hypothetical protein n=1 Tax=Clostridium sp. TaxID=1506 RepID=UPI0026330155|nr:hypothetical protein [Clostridium sp.]